MDRPLKAHPIVKYAESLGKVRIKKAYADWSKKKFSQYQKLLISEGFELIHLPETNLMGKNGSDMRLVIDVMGQLQQHHEVNTIIIGSGDSDFIPLTQHMLNQNKEVVVIGFDHSVSDMVRNYCTEFISLQEILGSAKSLAASPEGDSSCKKNHPPVSPEARELLMKFLKGRMNQEPIALSVLKQELLKMDPSFSETDWGFKKFRKFIRSFQGDLVNRMEKRHREWLVYFDEIKEADASEGMASPVLLRERPAFEEARQLVLKMLEERGSQEPLPMARFKPLLLKLDPEFSEKKLGYRYFKHFAEELVGDLVEKISVENHNYTLHFSPLPEQKPLAITSGKTLPLMPNGTYKSFFKPQMVEKLVREEAKNYLTQELSYNVHRDQRLQMGHCLIEGFQETPWMNLEQMKAILRDHCQKPASTHSIRKFILSLKYGGAFVPSKHSQGLSSKLLGLKSVISHAEDLDDCYIQQIGKVMKSKFPSLSNNEIVEILF